MKSVAPPPFSNFLDTQIKKLQSILKYPFLEYTSSSGITSLKTYGWFFFLLKTKHTFFLDSEKERDAFSTAKES